MLSPILNMPQASAYNSDAKETFLIGGVGMGKSYFLGLTAYRALCTKNAVILIAAPTVKMLRNSTMVQIQRAWSSFGFLQDKHYTIGKIPPQGWNVQRLSGIVGGRVLTTFWGSYAILDGLDNFNSQRGTELDEIFIDEFRDVDERAREVLLGRLRGSCYSHLGKKHRIWYSTTPPENVKFLRDIYNESLNDSDIEFHFGTTLSNAGNLPKGYADSLKKTLDSVTYRREVLGELIMVTENKFMYAFDIAKHVGKTEPNRNNTIYLSFDFNINPMTCVAFQHGNVTEISVLKEWALNKSDIHEMCRVIKPFIKGFANVRVTGDSTGNNSSAYVQRGITYYTIIQNELGIRDNAMNVGTRNLYHSDSRVICNSVIENYNKFVIDPSCKGLIDDLQYVKMSPDGNIDKSDPNHTHLLDCLRYYIHAYHLEFLKHRNKVKK